MEEMLIQGSTMLATAAGVAAAEKTGEGVANRALNWVVDNLKVAKGSVKAKFKAGFSRYLHNAILRYNKVSSLATASSSRTIVGADSIYVNIGVRYAEKEISTDTVDEMLQVSNHILIVGTGGSGKSMLMRYLFINTVHRGTYVPVLLELRKLSNYTASDISIEDLIYSCMDDFDVELPRDEFEYSLRAGKYLFLLDGFDEVKTEIAATTAEAIQRFCSKYPKNCCIVTSRPREDSAPLQTFTVMETMTMNKEQAMLLASKLRPSDEKTVEFCKQLNDDLYDRHKGFAQNPLLLSMMFLTFLRNNSIPEHLSEFYKKAFDALYSEHDNYDKGSYHREFKCAELEEEQFKAILAHFCFHSYLKEMYEFAEDELLTLVTNAIQKVGAANIAAKDYIEDLRKVVCFLVREGTVYRFAHRSFQAYFAAYYTEKYLTDEQQVRLFEKLLRERYIWILGDYYKLLQQMQYDRFAYNALEPELRRMYVEASRSDDPEWEYVKMICESVEVRQGVPYLTMQSGDGERAYRSNIYQLFRFFFDSKKNRSHMNSIELSEVREAMLAFIALEPNEVEPDSVFVDCVETSVSITEEERSMLIQGFKYLNFALGVHNIIGEWLEKLEMKRRLLESDDFFDSL